MNHVVLKSTLQLLIAVLALLSAPAFSSSWHCRNNDLEIRCGSGKCETADSFTPFDIRINTSGPLSICAYSGCWVGIGRVVTSGKHILVSGTRLKWTGTDPSTAAFIVAVDVEDKVGFVKGEGFAMPTSCVRQSK